MSGFSTTVNADNIIQACPVQKSTIFLTFDDGIEPGTAEIYALLKAKQVPATFFCVGENVLHPQQAELFRKIYDDPTMAIGNHSMSHGHQFYQSFYGEEEFFYTNILVNSDNAKDGRLGLRINPTTGLPDGVLSNTAARRSVLMDFEYANHAFTSVLIQVCIPYPPYAPDYFGLLNVAKLPYSRFLTARMPGTNTWLLDDITAHHSRTRDEEGNDLRQNGYNIYGWDDEWEMKFEVKEAQTKEYAAGEDGVIDLYSAQFIDQDRPTETAAEVFARVESAFNARFFDGLKKDDKLILLLHDRAFRCYKADEPQKYIQQLDDFITQCQKAGYCFDLLENY